MTVEIENLLRLDGVHDTVEAATEAGTIRQAEIAEIVELHELDPLETDALYRELEQRGVDLLDEEPPREPTPPPPPVVVQPVESTTDALQLFLREAGKHRLLTASEEVTLAKRIERGDFEAKQRMIQSNLRLVVSIAKNY